MKFVSAILSQAIDQKVALEKWLEEAGIAIRHDETKYHHDNHAIVLIVSKNDAAPNILEFKSEKIEICFATEADIQVENDELLCVVNTYEGLMIFLGLVSATDANLMTDEIKKKLHPKLQMKMAEMDGEQL